MVVRVSTLTEAYGHLERMEGRFDPQRTLRGAIDRARIRVDHLLVLTALDQENLGRMGHPELREEDPAVLCPGAEAVLEELRSLRMACTEPKRPAA